VPAGRRDGRDLVIELRVQPRAQRSEFAGLHGGRLRVRLQAPPVDGRANAALVEFLAKAFSVPRAQVVVESGLASRDKRVRVLGAPPSPPSIRDLLGCD
jgi:uncharacterized protein (TIGR00251 family)